MSLPTLDRNGAVLLTASIAAIGIAYDAAEFYSSRREVLDLFYDWKIVRSRYYILLNRPVLSLLFDLLCGTRLFMVAIVVHGLAALLFPIAIYHQSPLAAALAAFVLTVHCLTNVRLLVGRDGADQMQTIVWAGLFAFSLPLTEMARTAALGFIAAQLVLSYWTSGIAKVFSPAWREGSAVHLITRMATYCSPGLARACGKRSVSMMFSRLTILFEVCGPVLLLVGRRGAFTFVALGTLFHFGIAITMGLTTFLFAFLAAFPIIYYFAGSF
jgi:hypothetical protein